MKKLQFVMVALFAISMLAPSSGTAEPTHPNEIGLYTTPDGYGETGTDLICSPIDVYLVLTKPRMNNEPCSGITYFSCMLNFNPQGGIFLTGNAFNGGGINLGDDSHIQSGFIEYIVELTNPVPTVNDAVLLVSLQFINDNLSPVEVTLGPASIPCIPGQMDFMQADPPCEIMYSMGGSHDAPVFIFNGEAVAVEDESFGSVKALYR